MFDTVDTIKKSLDIMAGMLSGSDKLFQEKNVGFNSAGFSNATELTGYLAKKIAFQGSP